MTLSVSIACHFASAAFSVLMDFMYSKFFFSYRHAYDLCVSIISLRNSQFFIKGALMRRASGKVAFPAVISNKKNSAVKNNSYSAIHKWWTAARASSYSSWSTMRWLCLWAHDSISLGLSHEINIFLWAHKIKLVISAKFWMVFQFFYAALCRK